MYFILLRPFCNKVYNLKWSNLNTFLLVISLVALSNPWLFLFYLCIYIQLLLLFSHSVVSNCLRPHGLQHARLPYPSPSPRACSNSCPLSWWCHPTISSSVIPFSSVFPSIRIFSSESTLYIRWPKYWRFSFSISPSNEYLGFPLGWTGWISLQSKGLSRVSQTP